MPHTNPYRPPNVADAEGQLAARAFALRVAAQVVPSGVVPGAYTSADITVGADGRLTAAANGAGGGGLSRGEALDMFNLPTFL